MSYIKEQMNKIISQNPGEKEFHQAVYELLSSTELLFKENSDYKTQSIIERITEPDRQVKFRVTWKDDNGKVNVNRGYRVQFNNSIGPYKGGLRFHPSVNISIIKFLGFEQIFKNALTGLPIGGGKGGSDFDPKNKSDNEIMNFCQSFMTELFRYIGPETDIPAGDIGVGAKEIGYMFGQYKRLKNIHNGVITGKGIIFGGSHVRKESTGYGLIYITEKMLNKHKKSIKDSIISISGAGNVAIHAAEKAQQLGGKVVTLSDSTGWIYDANGIDIQIIKKIKEQKKLRLTEYKKYFPKSEYTDGKFMWTVPCDIALPCATQNELNLESANNLIKNNIVAVAEGANMPCTTEAKDLFLNKKILFLPGKSANAGGVSTSVLEMSQNSAKFPWDFKEVDVKLQKIMENIFNDISNTAQEYGFDSNYIKGSDISSFKKVSKAILEQGIL